MRDRETLIQNYPVNEEVLGTEEDVLSKEPESRISQLGRYNIDLQFLSSGMIIRIGCKQIAFSTITEGMSALNEWVKDPTTESEKWNKIFNQ